jgi:hypothetical protein
MTTFDPPYSGSPAWQLPWLRVALILRAMAANTECRDEELAELLSMRRRVAQGGWFN